MSLKQVLKLKRYPSRTAQNALNFLKKEEEEKLITFNDKKMLKTFLDCIVLLLPDYHKYDHNQDDSLGYNYTQILQLYNVDSLSKLLIYLEMLFLRVIYKNVYLEYSITLEAIEKLSKLIENHPIVIDTTELSKCNNFMSFISFSIREIYDFLTIKDPHNNILIYNLRKSYKEYRFLLKEDQLSDKVKESL
jgi:hypothetical protein